MAAKTQYQRCVGAQLRGKHVKGKRAMQALFRKAAKKCAKGAKVRKKYTRKYRRVGKRRRAVGRRRKSTARRMKRVGTIVCRLK